MLDSLGIELGRERDLYASDLEYAAALLDTDPGSIDDLLIQDFSQLHEDAARWQPTHDRPSTAPDASAAAAERISGTRRVLIVWGPFVLGLSVLALSAVLSRTFGP